MSVADFISHFWGELSKKVTKSVVFLDNPAAECLHWAGGVNLLAKGSLIREFSSFESVPDNYKKAVFVISSPISGNVEVTLKSIIKSSYFEYCVVVTCCHPAVHAWSQTPDSRDWNVDDRLAFSHLEENLLHWMGNVNLTAEVFYLPLFSISPCPSLLLTPTFSNMFPPLVPDLARSANLWQSLHPGQTLTPDQLHEWPVLPLQLQVRVRQLVAGLHSLLSTLGAKEEIWSLGGGKGLAKHIGDQLEGWAPARARRKTATNKVSLIILDRSMDVASCSQYGRGNTLMARAVEVLDRLPDHTVDLRVDLTGLFGMSSPGSSECLVPGSLASSRLRSSDAEIEQEEMNMILLGQEKDCLNLLHKNLLESSPTNRKSESGGKKFVTAATLEADLKVFEGDYNSILSNISTVTRARAAVTCITADLNIRRKKLGALCTQFARTIGQDMGTGVLTEITDLVRGRRNNNLQLEDILLLLVYVYSSLDVRDSFPSNEEDRLRSVLGEAVLFDGLGQGLGSIIGELARREQGESSGLDELVALNVVNSIWERLDGIKSCRKDLSKFQSLIDGEGDFTGLVEQLLGEVYHPNRHDVSDLHHHSGGLSSLLRSGLGWLGSAPAKTHPRESPWVILFVVGGVTAAEVAASQAYVAGTESKLTIASTRLLSPADTMDLVFLNDCLMV